MTVNPRLNEFYGTQDNDDGPSLDACKDLLVEMLESVIRDYKTLERFGIVEAGVQVKSVSSTGYLCKNGRYKARRFRGSYDSDKRVQELLWFMRSDALDDALYSIGLEVDGARIRTQLGFV